MFGGSGSHLVHFGYSTLGLKGFALQELVGETIHSCVDGLIVATAVNVQYIEPSGTRIDDGRVDCHIKYIVAEKIRVRLISLDDGAPSGTSGESVAVLLLSLGYG